MKSAQNVMNLFLVQTDKFWKIQQGDFGRLFNHNT